METLEEAPEFQISAVGFKSYYVVWKRYLPKKTVALLSAFKSYYVVWKRPGAKIRPLHSGLFKSYYVVWKLLFKRYKKGWVISLNRTM